MEDYKMKKAILIEDINCEQAISLIRGALSKILGVCRIAIDQDYIILDADTEVKDYEIKYTLNKLGFRVKKILTL
ncbi:hypothetical protein GC105_02090 [Alkalibaculum sp. M08DMB]|uniref:HMA domain-containing protein n=1 Tax=Alkalibaculum sporogenes TaxID=2655001 RepID=A0A6A7K569_9FIRM|nr:hypothetical protein [Alkalibaculum sporogenes]MPW24582.1 hypothetical protein [Alkalibaculum sporogenes]